MMFNRRMWGRRAGFRPGNRAAGALLLGALLLATMSACRTTPGPPSVPPSPTMPSPTATSPLPTSTPRPNRLVLCTTEPAAISPFAPSQAGDDLLALFYEPPLERLNYVWEARLVEEVPTLTNGGALTRTVSVPPGGRYVSKSGTVHVNESEETLQRPQMVVSFTLRSDLRWSDGKPLMAEDALLGYHLAQEPEVVGRWRELVERTERFEALNSRTLRWTGVPGYLDADFAGFLFPPQPVHRYQGQRLAEILNDRAPVGNGAFAVVEWTAGEGLRLLPNPHYVGPKPALKEIRVRFPQLPLTSWPTLLANGTCDVILPDPAGQITWQTWAPLIGENRLRLWLSTGPEPTFLRLDFNIARPDGRANPLADLTVRTALAQCIDRQCLVEGMPDRALVPAESFLPPEHPAFDPAVLRGTAYDPDVARAMLETTGWRDEDGDGLREAHDVPGFDDGEPLSLTLVLAPQYTVAAAHVAADLEACGVGVAPRPTDVRQLYVADPASPLFGRTFDLALFGWWAEAPQVCGAWRSDRIPSEENDWVGENFSGFASEAYDEACHRALTAVDIERQYAALKEAQGLLSHALPTHFLTWRPFWFAARPEVKGIHPDPSNPATLWNIEALTLRP
ncbi:MAG: ABC transporter substrate-binding protein [Anaerolineae bacterium]